MAAVVDMQNAGSPHPAILRFISHVKAGCLVFNDTRGGADPVEASHIVELRRYYRREAGPLIAASDR